MVQRLLAHLSKRTETWHEHSRRSPANAIAISYRSIGSTYSLGSTYSSMPRHIFTSEQARDASRKAEGKRYKFTQEQARFGGFLSGKKILEARGPEYFQRLAARSHLVRRANKWEKHAAHCRRHVSLGTKSCSVPTECRLLNENL